MQIRKGGHKDLEHFYPLMEMDFDSEEIVPKIALHKAIMNGSLELLIEYDEESKVSVGYAVVCPCGVYGYVLLKHMGIMPWLRGKGMGAELVRHIHRRYASRQGIIAEITDFPDADPDHQKKLNRFFSRFGYVEERSDYRIGGTTAHLWVKPIQGTQEIAPVAHRIIPDFYNRFLLPSTVRKMIDIRQL